MVVVRERALANILLCLQVLCIQGFLACRKHADRILLLVEMMAGSGFPCFKGGARTVQQLRRRFHLNLPEAQVRLLQPTCSALRADRSTAERICWA